MKLVYLAFSLIFLQCQTKYFIYKRNSLNLNEQIEMNTKSGVFIFQSDSSALTYKARGKLELVDSNIYLKFPENAEASLLSPFKKGYYELTKYEESTLVEIEILNYDVRTKGKLSPSRHFSPSIEVLSFEDSVLIEKLSYSQVQLQLNENKVLLRSKVSGYFDQHIIIPGSGKYQLSLYLQPLQTIESYETTATDCYRVVSGPILCLKASEVENRKIKKLLPVGESYIPYSMVESPYFLVGTEKRRLKLF